MRRRRPQNVLTAIITMAKGAKERVHQFTSRAKKGKHLMKAAQKLKKPCTQTKQGIIYITHEGFRQHAQQLLLNLIDLGGKARAVCQVVLLKRILNALDENHAKELQKTIFINDEVVKANPEYLEHPEGCICGHAHPTRDELTKLYWAKAGSSFLS